MISYCCFLNFNGKTSVVFTCIKHKMLNIEIVFHFHIEEIVMNAGVFEKLEKRRDGVRDK